MTQEEVQKLFEENGVFFKDLSYGRVSTKTIMLMTLHNVVNKAIDKVVDEVVNDEREDKRGLS